MVIKEGKKVNLCKTKDYYIEEKNGVKIAVFTSYSAAVYAFNQLEGNSTRFTRC